jgi:hypothetical protein
VKFEMILTFKDKSSRSVGESSLSVGVPIIGAPIVGAASPCSPANYEETIDEIKMQSK